MIYIGIDPGRSGSMAVIKGNEIDGYFVEYITPFDEEKYIRNLVDIHNGIEPAICCLEHVTSMPKQGVTSTFNFGMNFGWIQGLLQGLSIPYELVRPQKWKKEFSVTADKNSSIDVCKRLFPNVILKATDKCRKDNDGMAEALLMAEYARRKF